MLSGVRLAGPIGDCREPICRFARHLGVAYQILNDLDDWAAAGSRSERPRGTDLLGGRPTVLWALALAGLPPAERGELLSLPGSPAGTNGFWLARGSCTFKRGRLRGRPPWLPSIATAPAWPPKTSPSSRCGI